jgi:hypothetical protein
MSENITDFIKHSVDEKPVAAFKSLEQELKDRANIALDDFKVNVTKNMFNGETDEQSS